MTKKAFDIGKDAGKNDGWMTVESTLEETQRDHPQKSASDLVQTDIDFWEETDHFGILYAGRLMQLGKGKCDVYSDLKAEFWEGYLQGRKEIGIDIYKIAEGLIKGK